MNRPNLPPRPAVRRDRLCRRAARSRSTIRILSTKGSATLSYSQANAGDSMRCGGLIAAIVVSTSCSVAPAQITYISQSRSLVIGVLGAPPAVDAPDFGPFDRTFSWSANGFPGGSGYAQQTSSLNPSSIVITGDESADPATGLMHSEAYAASVLDVTFSLAGPCIYTFSAQGPCDTSLVELPSNVQPPPLFLEPGTYRLRIVGYHEVVPATPTTPPIIHYGGTFSGEFTVTPVPETSALVAGAAAALAFRRRHRR
jgi:hypothetical protein